jgi:hypothetical protein
MARQRRPRAIQVKGGLWMRPPKPKPKPKPPRYEEGGEEQQQGSESYESCDEGGSELLQESLVAAVQPAIHMLLRLGETDAASAVQALCDYANEREEGHARLKRAYARCRSKLSHAHDKIRGKENLKGQTGRYWWRIQKLQRQLFQERMKACSRRQWYPP